MVAVVVQLKGQVHGMAADAAVAPARGVERWVAPTHPRALPPTPPLHSTALGHRDGVRGRRQPAAVCGGGRAPARVAGALLLPAAHPSPTGAVGHGWCAGWGAACWIGRWRGGWAAGADCGLQTGSCPALPAHFGASHPTAHPQLLPCRTRCSTATPTCALRTATSSWATCC